MADMDRNRTLDSMVNRRFVCVRNVGGQAWRIPAARLRDVLPALHALGLRGDGFRIRAFCFYSRAGLG